MSNARIFTNSFEVGNAAIPTDSLLGDASLPQQKYELLRRLASGGMGEVFVARCHEPQRGDRWVALKLLLPALTDRPDFIRRFLDEARIAARMDHPNIVRVFDLGLMDGRYFLAMELVEGVSLRVLLNACRRAGQLIPLSIVRLIASGLCESLDYAHALADDVGRPLGLVHRDVNPANILLSSAGRVLLTDFGIAKAEGVGHGTETGELVGKLAYMSPEQFGREGVDRRADVYAAGVTIYEALTLRSAFRRTSLIEMLDAVRFDEIVPVDTLRADIGPTMAIAVSAAMARDKDGRTPSAHAFLEGLLDGPVATPEELGAFVQQLCGESIVSLPELADEEKAIWPPAETRAMPVEEGPVPETRFMPSSVDLLPLEDPNAPLVPPPPLPVRQAAPRYRNWIASGALVVGLGVLGLHVGMGTVVSSPAAPVAASPAVTLRSAAKVQRPVVEPVAPTPRVSVAALLRADRPSEVAARIAPVQTRKALRRVGPTPLPTRQPTPKKVPPTDPIAPGYLSADAQPWGEVWVNGRLTDRTPSSRIELPPGQHEVILINPELHTSIRRVVQIESGRTERLLVNLAE